MQNSSQTPVVTNFTDSNQFDLVINQLRKDISEKNELLEAVRERINALVIKAKKNTVPGKESFHY